MINEPIHQAIINALNQILGVEADEIHLHTDLKLDLNADDLELQDIKEFIETQLDITLPDFEEALPATVADLQAMVDDSLL